MLSHYILSPGTQIVPENIYVQQWNECELAKNHQIRQNEIEQEMVNDLTYIAISLLYIDSRDSLPTKKS